MSKTLVLDINEIYRVVPETKSLEGKNFKDVRELLKDLISAVETSGKWQFIQYVNNKPSLFIIREETAENIDTNKLKSKLKKLIAQVEKDVKTIGDAVPTGFLAAQSAQRAYVAPKLDPATDAYSTDEFEDTDKAVEKLDDSVPQTKLPWE
jgi:hypothetical protein